MASVSIPLGDVVARRVQSSTSLLVLGLLFGYGTGAMVESQGLSFVNSRQSNAEIPE